MKSRWTAEEIKILQNNYNFQHSEDLYNLLPNRTWQAIQNKSNRLGLHYQTITSEQRFWKYVNKESDDKCWNWTGVCNKDGYGCLMVDRSNVRTHRFSWELHFSKIPDGLLVCHYCDNPPCVNPYHLFLGTNKDNIEDRDNKNRQAKGESHGNTKLTYHQVKEIRRLCNEGKFSQRKIAKMFNIGKTAVGDIHNNKRWKKEIQ